MIHIDARVHGGGRRNKRLLLRLRLRTKVASVALAHVARNRAFAHIRRYLLLLLLRRRLGGWSVICSVGIACRDVSCGSTRIRRAVERVVLVNLAIDVAFLADVPILTVATLIKRSGDALHATMVTVESVVAGSRWILGSAIAGAGAHLVRQTAAVATVLPNSTAESLLLDLASLFTSADIVFSTTMATVLAGYLKESFLDAMADLVDQRVSESLLHDGWSWRMGRERERLLRGDRGCFASRSR